MSKATGTVKHYTCKDAPKVYTPEDVKDLRAKVLRINGICNQYSPQQVADLINAAVAEAVEVEREACAKEVDKFFFMHDGQERMLEHYGDFDAMLLLLGVLWFSARVYQLRNDASTPTDSSDEEDDDFDYEDDDWMFDGSGMVGDE